jgi:hypothetical protein
MCPLLAQLEIGFFSSFFAAAVYSTNEANKAGLKQSIIFRCLWSCVAVTDIFALKTLPMYTSLKKLIFLSLTSIKLS